jgi:hypothetical protein
MVNTSIELLLTITFIIVIDDIHTVRSLYVRVMVWLVMHVTFGAEWNHNQQISILDASHAGIRPSLDRVL